jgi:hypothetical protein
VNIQQQREQREQREKRDQQGKQHRQTTTYRLISTLIGLKFSFVPVVIALILPMNVLSPMLTTIPSQVPEGHKVPKNNKLLDSITVS